MIIESMPVGPFMMNAYVVGCPKSSACAVIDAGDVAPILDMAGRHKMSIVKLLQTHGHIDHVAGLASLRQETGAPIWMHREELSVYETVAWQASLFGLPPISVHPPDHFFAEGDLVEIGSLQATVIETPGHTPGGVCLYFEKEHTIFVGDTLFAGSIGRTDLPGGDFQTIQKSLARLIQLPDQTRVYSGHGPMTTIGTERRSNPFLTELA